MISPWRNSFVLGSFAVLAALAAVCAAQAGAAGARDCVAARPPAELTLDGIVKGEPAWAKLAARAFGHKRAGDRPTRFRLAFAAAGLHVAVECAEPATDSIKAEGEDMDPLWREDSVEVLLQPPGAAQPYRAVVSAIGARTNNGGRLGDWQARTFTGKGYWSAEIVIPFETLAALPDPKAAWRFDIRRNIRTVDPPVTASWAAGASGADGLAPLRFAGRLPAKTRKAIEQRIARERALAGSTLAYSRSDTGQLFLRLGRRPRKILNIGGAHLAPRLLPGGREMLINSRKGGSVGVWRVDLAGGSRRRICDGDQVSVSADGRRIAFRRAGAILERLLATGDERRISPAGLTDCAFPGFGPGGEVMFVARGRPDRLLVVASGGEPEMIFAGEIASAPRCSPDGRWIACQDGAHLWLIDRATKRRRLLTAAGGVQSGPAWSRDSARVCYGQGLDPYDDALDVYCVDIDRPGSVRVVTRKAHPGFDWTGLTPPAGEPEAVPLGSTGCLTIDKPTSVSAARMLLASKRRKWDPLPSAETNAAGVIVRNGAAALLLSKGADRAMLLFGSGGEMAVGPLDGEGKPCGALTAARLKRTPTGAAAIEATFASAGGRGVKLRLTLHARRAAVEAAPLAGGGGVAVGYVFEGAVVTDRLASDLLLDASRSAAAETVLPHAPVTFLVGRAGLAMVVTPSGKQTTTLLKGRARNRFSGLTVLSAGEPVHVAALAGEGLWRRVEFPSSGSGAATAKWTSPHRAQWRLAGRRGDAPASTMIDADTPVKSLQLPLAAESAFVYLHGRTRHTPLGLTTPADVLWDVLGPRAAEELADTAGVRGSRMGRDPVPLKDPRVTLTVLGWIRGSRRAGVTETVGHLCDDLVSVIAGLDDRIGEYETMCRSLEAGGEGGDPCGATEAVKRARAAAAAIEPAPVAGVKAAGDALTGVANRRRQMSSSREFRRLRDVFNEALEKRRRIVAIYRRLAKDVRNRAGLAVTTRPKTKAACERLRSAAGAALRNRYHLEADWRGETPLSPTVAPYEKIKKL